MTDGDGPTLRTLAGFGHHKNSWKYPQVSAAVTRTPNGNLTDCNPHCLLLWLLLILWRMSDNKVSQVSWATNICPGELASRDLISQVYKLATTSACLLEMLRCENSRSSKFFYLIVLSVESSALALRVIWRADISPAHTRKEALAF